MGQRIPGIIGQAIGCQCLSYDNRSVLGLSTMKCPRFGRRLHPSHDPCPAQLLPVLNPVLPNLRSSYSKELSKGDIFNVASGDIFNAVQRSAGYLL